MDHSSRSRGEVTRLLSQLTHGDHEVFDELYSSIYGSLLEIAHRQLRGERDDHTLATSDLVHEAYLKLIGLAGTDWKGRSQFFGIAARAMRQILVNHALTRRALKRGGGVIHENLDDVALGGEQRSDSLLALDEALRKLASLDARQALIVECRYFGGMSIEETAVAAEVSTATVKRDWTAARAWLNRELGEGR